MTWRKKLASWSRVTEAVRPSFVVALRRGDYVVAAACWLAVMCVYWQTLPPTVTGEDSGELITAAYTLGVAHPPGYPIWCLLGKVFTFIPHGTVAWRVAFMSAFWGAGTVFLGVLFMIKLTRSRLAGAAAGFAMAFSSEFWEQSVISEVYSLNAFLTLLCMLILIIWYETRRTRLLYLFAAIYSLGLCGHNTMHFLGPVFGLFILSVDYRPWQHWQTYLRMAGITFVIWFVIHLYLPIRSLADPPVDWGNPETWEGFWDVVMRQQYSFGFAKNPRTLARTVQQLWTFAKLYCFEFTPWLAALPLLGAYGLWKLNRRGAVFVVGVFLHISLGFIAVLNFNIDKESIWVNNVFFMPAYIMAAMLVGGAVAWLSQVQLRGRRLLAPAAMVTAGVALVPLASNYHHNDKSQYFFAYDFAKNIFDTLEPDAVYFPVADHATFPLLYLQAVEGIRPDVLIGNKYGYTEEDLYEDMPVELKTRFGKIPGEADQAVIEDWFIANTDRPVFFTRKRPILGAPGVEMTSSGLLYKAVGPGRPRTDRDFWSEYTWHTLDKADTRGEFTAEAILSDYYFFYGRHLLETGETDRGLDALRMSLDVAGAEKETLNNVGSACAEYAQLSEAEGYFLRSLDTDPDYMLALQNLARLYLQMQQPDKALAPLQRIVELKPGDIEARWLRVQCLQGVQRPQDALAELQVIAKMTPDDPGVYKQMGFIYLATGGNVLQAQQMFARSLQLNPNQPELLEYLNTTEPTPGESAAEGPVPDVPMPELPEVPEVPSPESLLPQMPHVPTAPSEAPPAAGAPTPAAPPMPLAPTMPTAPMPAMPPMGPQ